MNLKKLSVWTMCALGGVGGVHGNPPSESVCEDLRSKIFTNPLIVTEIFKHLSEKDLLAVRATNKFFNKVVRTIPIKLTLSWENCKKVSQISLKAKINLHTEFSYSPSGDNYDFISGGQSLNEIQEEMKSPEFLSVCQSIKSVICDNDMSSDAEKDFFNASQKICSILPHAMYHYSGSFRGLQGFLRDSYVAEKTDFAEKIVSLCIWSFEQAPTSFIAPQALSISSKILF